MLSVTGSSVWIAGLAVSTGAMVGALSRWVLSAALNSGAAGAVPAGTLICNLLGAFLIGLALSYFATSGAVSPCWKLFLVTGVLGSLTTFSTFSAENVGLLLDGFYAKAFLHAGLHLAGSLLMTGFGFWCWRLLFK